MAIYIKGCSSYCVSPPFPEFYNGYPVKEINDGDEISLENTLNCTQYFYFVDMREYYCYPSTGVTFTNNSGSPLTINAVGVVADDLVVDGVVYEDGEYCYWSDDCDGGYQPCASEGNFHTNGPHSFDYTQVLNDGDSMLIQGSSNGSDTASMYCYISTL
jgi:hypothetical protein